jgi:hypothetical protein
MGRKKEKKEKWRFWWKNIGGLGRINRLLAGVALLGLAWVIQDDKKKSAFAALMAADMLIAALLKWCPARAFLKWPTKRARLRHYPKEA